MNLARWQKLPGQGVASNLAANTNFGPLPVAGRRLSITAKWTGTPTGTFALQVLGPDGDWVPVPGAAAEFTANSQAQPAGGAGNAVWNWSNVPGAQVRLNWTGSGAGQLNASFVWGD